MNSRQTEAVAEENNRPEWLPDGWVVELRTRKRGSAMGRQYKVYIEPLSGCKFFSMPEVLRHLESENNRNSKCERKTTHTERSKHEDVRMQTESKITERVVVEKSTVDDLPPGWIKETRIRKSARGIRKDPYYTDPVSGYVFISKKDVFRYLETGEIGKYAFKPKNMVTDDPELVTEEALPSHDAKRQKLEHTAARRRLFPVKASSVVCNPVVSKAEALKKRRGKEVSAETGLAGAPTAEISTEQTAKVAIDKGAETKEISSVRGSALPKVRGSKRNQGKMVLADNGSVSTPVTDSLQGQRLVESHIEFSDGKTLNDTTKSAKKKMLHFPPRSSKRLAGLEPELVSHCTTIEQTPKNVTTESCKSKAILSQHLKGGLVPELANHVSSDLNIPSRGEPSNKFRSSGSQAIPGEQLQNFKSAENNDDKSEQHVSLFFGDSYLDPCLESAFKALMGVLPVNSNPDNGPVLNPASDILQEKSIQTTEGEKRSRRKTRINSMQSKNKQELNLPCRSSKRLAGFEPQLVVNCESLERAPKNVTTESCKSKSILAAGLTSSGLVDAVSPQLKGGPVLGTLERAPKNVTTESCKSILAAGLTSSDLVDEVSPQLKGGPVLGLPKRAPKNVATESCKSILAAGLTSSGLVDEVSPQFKTGPVLGLPNRASEVLGLLKCVSSEVKPPSSGEPSNKIKSLGNLAITGGQYAEANADKSEPHVSSSFGGSYLHPCKSTMGETWVDSVHDNEPVSTTSGDIVPEKKLQETKVGKSSNKKTRINSVKSKNMQKVSLPRRSSNRLAGLQPELASNSVTGEQACGNATIESYKSEAPTCGKTDPCGLEDSASQQVEAGNATMHTQHDCTNISTLVLEESSEKSSNPLEAQTVSEEPSQKLENEKPEEQPQKLENEKPEEQPQKLENEKPEEQPQKLENEKQEEQPQKLENERMDNENPDSQILFPFGDSWSDPCLEFAFKTLTGAIPVDENLGIQDYFQHQLYPSNSQKDDSLAQPNFGNINPFQTDVSHSFYAPEKQHAPSPQQQLHANPAPPPGNVSLPSCSTIASQPPFLRRE